MLNKIDPEIYALLKSEEKRQRESLMMIPSENHTSQAVRQAVGSCLQDKYCEGYPGKRYYQGQENFDKLEILCQKRTKKLFNMPFVNVQALSGAPANSAVYFGLLNPGDKIMGLKLDNGGHISHGLAINFSGKFYKTCFYYVDKQGLIDYEKLEKIAQKQKPKIIIAGITAYPRKLNFAKFAQIAKKINAYLMADISHVAGLIIAGKYPDPSKYADIITTTTHKTLRGPRGALIMTKNSELAQKIDKAVFPGLQGGPHMNNIAGIAVALKQAGKAGFRKYSEQVVKNAKALARALQKHDFNLCSGGTDTHLILMDLRNFRITGKQAAINLEKAGIITNYNTVPYDPNPPFNPSGLRLGTPAVTSRGLREREMQLIADFIAQVIKNNEIKQVNKEVRKLCRKFKIKTSY